VLLFAMHGREMPRQIVIIRAARQNHLIAPWAAFVVVFIGRSPQFIWKG
jgi:hypothetical protein